MPLSSIQQLSQLYPKMVVFERNINKTTVQNFLKAAVMKAKDAEVAQSSGPTRFEAAYDAMLLCALALFAAKGYKVTSELGHHRTALEGMAAELQLSETVHEEIVAIAEIRHTKYQGFLHVKDADMKLALKHAQRVMNDTEAWLLRHKPEVFKP